jgi:hypothetical protein
MSMAHIISSSLSVNCPNRPVTLALVAAGKILPGRRRRADFFSSGSVIPRRYPAAFFHGRGGQPSSPAGADSLLLRRPTAFFSGTLSSHPPCICCKLDRACRTGPLLSYGKNLMYRQYGIRRVGNHNCLINASLSREYKTMKLYASIIATVQHR